MLFRLKSVKTGFLFYLVKDKQYSVGRKGCDILITDDQSISRKHAALTVKNNSVFLCDFKSKYNTFVDENKLQPNTEFQLKNSSQIKFGMLESVYIFEEISIVTITSSIKSENKTKLKNDIDFLGGTLASNWTSKCTHVTVEEIFVTIKVVCAIIKGVPLVVPNYWTVYVDNVEKNLPPPLEEDYKPKHSQLLLKQKLSVEYREERRQLFNNKIFVFPTKSDRLKMEELIILAGGRAQSWDENPLQVKDFTNNENEYLIVQATDNNIKLDVSLCEIMDYNKNLGKRTIPVQEIALAILSCSCNKDCNPYIDRKGDVLLTKIETQESDHMILALETQSQPVLTQSTIKVDLIVPPSVESSLHMISETGKSNVSDHPQSITTSTNESGSVKREGESIDHLNISKKVKIDTTGNRSEPKETRASENLFMIKRDTSKQSNRVPSGKTLFAFKNSSKQIANTNITEDNNLFKAYSKKRKEVEPLSNNCKKIAVVSSTPQPSSTSKATMSKNPFANILKSKNSTEPIQASTITTTLKAKSQVKKSKLNVSIITDINSMQLNSSLIFAVDAAVQNSYSWISKSRCNQSVEKQSIVSNQSLDEDITKYIESFKNTVIIEEEPMVVKKSIVTVTLSKINNGGNNFKKFKKVLPLKIQTVIIPESSYKTIICDSHGMQVVSEDEEKDSDDNAGRVQKSKRRGRQFEF